MHFQISSNFVKMTQKSYTCGLKDESEYEMQPYAFPKLFMNNRFFFSGLCNIKILSVGMHSLYGSNGILGCCVFAAWYHSL